MAEAEAKSSSLAETGEKFPLEVFAAVEKAIRTFSGDSAVVKAVVAYGTSLFSGTARVDVENNGKDETYFFKVHYGEASRDLMHGEFESMKRIHSVKPTLVPKPFIWGNVEGFKNTHYLLTEFRQMKTTEDGENQVPDILEFVNEIAELHEQPAGTTAGGRFGSPSTTFHGEIPIEHGWSSTWEEYFSRTTRDLLNRELAARGREGIEGLDQLIDGFFDKVIPRLIRPMETNGRKISPALIHGDLWDGNAAVDAVTGKPVIFDAGSFYAHNEYELAVWSQPWNKLNAEYRKAYHDLLQPSRPFFDMNDRNKLYSVRVNILDSILYKDETQYRDTWLQQMRELVEKFAAGYDENDPLWSAYEPPWLVWKE